MKKMLRNKANFEILEGFLSALLGDDLTVRQLLESEGNVASEELKHNRLDMLVETSANELIIVELQYDSEWDYFHRHGVFFYPSSALMRVRETTLG